jgi:hypothetical protein
MPPTENVPESLEVMKVHSDWHTTFMIYLMKVHSDWHTTFMIYLMKRGLPDDKDERE